MERADFDLYHFRGKVDDFATKQMLEPKKRNTLALILEELIENILFPQVACAEIEIGISGETKEIEITLHWLGDACNLMELADEQGTMARVILKKRCSSIEHTFENHQNTLTLKLFGENK